MTIRPETNRVKPMTKKDAQTRHAKRRAQERYGLQLNHEDINVIIRAIQSNNPKLAQHVRTQSNRISHWKICWSGKVIQVVYDKLRKSIVTVLYCLGN